MTIADSKLASAWQRAAQDLGIDVEIPERTIDEDRARPEHELAIALIEDRDADHVIGREIRGALEALERELDTGSHCPSQHRLPGAGHILEQHVAAAEHGDQL